MFSWPRTIRLIAASQSGSSKKRQVANAAAETVRRLFYGPILPEYLSRLFNRQCLDGMPMRRRRRSAEH
jgi:hypothetical protein